MPVPPEVGTGGGTDPARSNPYFDMARTRAILMDDHAIVVERRPPHGYCFRIRCHLLLKPTDGNALAHAQRVVLVGVEMDAGHVSLYRDIGGEVVELALDGKIGGIVMAPPLKPSFRFQFDGERRVGTIGKTVAAQCM